MNPFQLFECKDVVSRKLAHQIVKTLGLEKEFDEYCFNKYKTINNIVIRVEDNNNFAEITSVVSEKELVFFHNNIHRKLFMFMLVELSDNRIQLTHPNHPNYCGFALESYSKEIEIHKIINILNTEFKEYL